MSDKNNTSADKAEESDRSPQVGALLRASRLRVGEDLRDVSEDLCIRYLYLEAIEDCRYTDLPGDTYAIGFIRSYAEHLGLDGEEVVRRYRAEQVSGKRLSDLSFPTPVPESGVPKGAIVLVGVVLAVLVYGGWYVTTTDESILSDLISPVPDRLQHLVDDQGNTNTDASAGNTSSDATVAGQAGSASDAETSTRVSQQTQEALDANTAEALAEATEAARDSISTPAETATGEVSSAAEQASETSVTETPAPETPTENTETPQPAVEAESAEPSGQPEQNDDALPASTESAGENSEVTSSQQSEQVSPETPSVNVTEDVTASAAPEEQSSDAGASSSDNQLTSAVEAAPSETPTAEVPETETSSTPAEGLVVSDTVEEAAATQTAEAEVTAEDLNARSLQAATTGGAVEPQQTEASTVPAAETAAAQPATTAAPAGDGIVIRAVESSWVQITDPASGEVVFTGLMNPGTSFDVPSRSGLLLDTGNAGAIDIFVDGATVPKLGGVGSVRKGVALDRERLLAGTATNR